MDTCIACGNPKGHNELYCSRDCYAKHRTKDRRNVPDTKVCSACKTEQPMSNYYTDNSRWDKKYPMCKDCFKVRNKTPEVNHRTRLSRYKLSNEEYRQLYQQQDGRCAICASTTNLHIDNDHDNGAVRGLLCRACNHGLGNFKDNPDYLSKAITYITRKVR